MNTKTQKLAKETIVSEDVALVNNDLVNTVTGEVLETSVEQPLNSVDSRGVEKETELATAPVLIPAEKLLAMESALSRLETMQSGVSMNAKYKEFTTEGETVRGVYLGEKTIVKGKGDDRKEIIGVTWIDNLKQVWINAGVTLRKQFEHIPSGTPVEITYTESIKVEIGKAKIYEVKPLY
ncbi:MAG: hypothetical protein EAZ92_07015 [Candidatus Kapaibacterium sp.]|nr:MAG: hypothetical protein EAZ92_07015 [Candidatus Kapabacteria bacterium]